jgi:two-component system, LytTR family, response regulator
VSAPLRVLLADDESMARQRLERLLGTFPDVELVGSCRSAEEVLEEVRKRPVDALLLDIHMPGLTGLEAAQLLPEPRPYIIFCTAHREHAVEAFDAGAVDYLLKPVDAARLKKALDRARRRLEAPAATDGISRLPIVTRQGIRLLKPEDISHVVLDGELATVFTATEQLITDATLQELQDKLAPFGFERVHRRALLHLGRVARLTPLETGGFLAHVRPGQDVEISRQVARELRKRLGLRKAREEEGD